MNGARTTSIQLAYSGNSRSPSKFRGPCGWHLKRVSSLHSGRNLFISPTIDHLRLSQQRRTKRKNGDGAVSASWKVRGSRGSGASATIDERRAMSWFSPKSKPIAACDGPANGDAIVVDHVTKKYGDFTAVDDGSFKVNQGEIFGLLGPNGAGKSTLIRMMTTLLPLTSGRALINGFDVAKDADSARHCMGVIPQALTSDIDLTVEENLSIYAKLYGVPAADRKRNIEELLQTVDLLKWRHAQTKTLSGGMRRRLEIARGLVH